MSFLTKSYDVFKKTVLVLMVLFVATLFVGAVIMTSSLRFDYEFDTVILIFFWVLFALQLYWIIKILYRYFDRAAKKSPKSQNRIAAVMLLAMAVGLGLVIAAIRYIPATDSFDDVETALLLLDKGKLDPNHMSYTCMGWFKNNYLLVILFSWLFRLFFAVGIHDILLPMFIINALCILLCAWLTWLSVKECFGAVNANKTLLLLVLNPVFYGIVEWVYSMTLALPIFSGILYCLIRAYKAKSLVGELVFGGILGLLTVLGYFIRVTSLFPLCAALVMIVFLVSKKKIYRKALVSGVAFLAAFAALWCCLTPVIDGVFGELKDRNLPVSYWLSFGAHDDGTFNNAGKDLAAANQIEDPAERSAFCTRQTVDYYKQNGVAKTIALWTVKNVVTFSDGYSTIHGRLSCGEINSDFFYLFSMPQRSLVETFADVHRVLLLFGILVLLIQIVRRKTALSESVFLLILTFFGAQVFYAFWESKGIYSAQFLPAMSVLAALGLSKINDNALFTKLWEKPKRRFAACGFYSVFCIAVCTMLLVAFGRLGDMDYGRIFGRGDTKHVPITAEKTIEQDFYCEKPFNHFCFPLKKLDESALANYKISVLDEQNTVLDSCLLSDENRIEVSNKPGQEITIDVLFDNSFSGGHYRVRLDKLNPEKGSIGFCAKNCYYIGSYRGERTVDGKGGFAGDLTMNVSYRVYKPYFALLPRLLIVAVFAAWSVGLSIGAVRCFGRNTKKE